MATRWRVNPQDQAVIEMKHDGAQWQLVARYQDERMAQRILAEMRQDDRDDLQRRKLKLPRGDLRLPDGRTLRRIMGFDHTKLPMNDVTRSGFLASAGWRNEPTGLIVTAGIEETERWGPLLHLSMSYIDHDPRWEEIKALRALFFPADVDVMMMLPKAGDYVNVHPHCYHLWQTPQEWGLL